MNSGVIRWVFRIFVLGIVGVAWGGTCWAIGPGDSVVVLYVLFPNGSFEVGTGVFVDHDGLILTADHVIHQTPADRTTMTSGTPPAPTEPSSIVAYSAALHAKLKVDLTANGTVGGNVASSTWIDAALVRASLNDTQRAQIQPLDVSITAPSQNEELTAWGPACVDIANHDCWAPEAVKLGLSSNPAYARDYVVRANLKKGYSGGPLVNSSYNVVAIGTWGDLAGDSTTTTQIFDATYLPSTYVAYFFFPKLVASTWLAGAQGCSHTQSLPYLTLFDMGELFPVASLTAPTSEQCSCCCNSLPRAPNALNSRISMLPCLQQPNCLNRQIFPLANEIQIQAVTGHVDASTAANYAKLRQVFGKTDKSKLSKSEQIRLYDAFASASALIASKYATKSQSFATAPADSLFAYNKLLQLEDSPKAYFEVGSVLDAQGNSDRASAARLLGEIVAKNEPESSQKAKTTKDGLRQEIFEDAPKQLAMPSPR